MSAILQVVCNYQSLTASPCQHALVLPWGAFVICLLSAVVVCFRRNYSQSESTVVVGVSRRSRRRRCRRRCPRRRPTRPALTVVNEFEDSEQE